MTRSRNRFFAVMSACLLPVSLACVAPAVAQAAEVAPRAAASPEVAASGRIVYTKNGPIWLSEGTKVKMICYFNRAALRYFYIGVSSGKHKGKYGDIHADGVRNQIRVKRCG